MRVDKDYRFETDEGSASLTDLFRGRSQLLVYHFMFGPDYTAGCPSCSAIADGFNGIVVHLANHDVDALGGLARAARRSCRPTSGAWAGPSPGRPRAAATSTSTSTSRSPRSSSAAGGIEYNYRREPAMRVDGRRTDGGARQRRSSSSPPCRAPTSPTYTRDRPGLSAFVLRGRRRLPHLFRLLRAASTASGACISGSTARRKGRNEDGALVAAARRVRGYRRQVRSRVSHGRVLLRTGLTPPELRSGEWDGRASGSPVLCRVAQSIFSIGGRFTLAGGSRHCFAGAT